MAAESPPEAGERWAHPVVLAAAAAFPTLAAWAYFAAAARADGSPNPLAQALYAAGKVAQFGLPVLWLAATAPGRLRPARPRVAGVGLGVAFGLLVSAGVLGLYAALPTADMAARVRAKLAEFHADRPAVYAAFGVFLCLAHSFLEEWYWRGFVHAGLRRRLPFAAAAALSSLAFAAHHVVILDAYLPGRFWAATVPLALAVAAGGAAWAWLYERSGSLAGPWLSHLIVDAALVAVGADMLFRRPG